MKFQAKENKDDKEGDELWKQRQNENSQKESSEKKEKNKFFWDYDGKEDEDYVKPITLEEYNKWVADPNRKDYSKEFLKKDDIDFTKVADDVIKKTKEG